MLPLSYLGTGLDLSHSLVGAKRVFSIKYAAEMEVEDATLVSTLPSTSVVRTLSHAAGLLTFVPLQTLHTLFKRRRLRQSQVDERAASDNFDAAAMARPMARERSLSSSVVAGVRDYGNQ
jgi:hypothetical protein